MTLGMFFLQDFDCLLPTVDKELYEQLILSPVGLFLKDAGLFQHRP